MEEIKNVIVEQTDILKIVNYLNNYYLEKQKEFEATEALIKEEEAEYTAWSKRRQELNYPDNYPEFVRKEFQNKRDYASMSVDINYKDGSSYTNKPIDEFLGSLAHHGFAIIESLSINMHLAYKKYYKADDFSFDSANRIEQDVYVRFSEEYISYNISGANAEAEVTRIKEYILSLFHSLQPRLSEIITKRNKIKYNSTLYLSFSVTAILLIAAAIAINTYIPQLNLQQYKLWLIPAYVVLSFFLNVIIPPFRLMKLYSLITPKQTVVYDSYTKSLENVDNIKDFVSYPEVQIGSNAKKANVRQEILKIQKKSKTKNMISFIINIILVTSVARVII